MSTSNYRLGMVAMATIVALRLGIGMHFFTEGASKLKSDKAFSQYFLESAKGPLAPQFKSMIWDREGRHRLGLGRDDYGKPTIDLTPTLDAWDQFRTQVVDYYALGEEQRDEAQQIVSDHEEQLKWYFGLIGSTRDNAEGLERRDEIIKYFKGLERAEINRADVARQDVPSLWHQSQTIIGAMQGRRNEWLWEVDQIWRSLETDLNALGADAGDSLTLARLGRRPYDSVAVDRFIPWFNMAVGALLIVGLFTRAAGLAAGLFLATVCLSQWPTAIGAQPIWYQLVEMLACFALVGLAAGRFAGLDSILHNIRMWCCPPKEISDTE